MKFVEVFSIALYVVKAVNVKNSTGTASRLNAAVAFLSEINNLPHQGASGHFLGDGLLRNHGRMPPVGDGADPGADEQRYSSSTHHHDADELGVFSSPVSTAMRCIMALAAQYFGVYTLLAIWRTISHLSPQRGENSIQKVLESATFTVSYAPMLAVLFLACRLRALQLSGFHGEPPVFVQACMIGATWAVFVQLLLVLALPCLTREVA